MKKLNSLFPVFVLLVLQSCSSQQIHSMIQSNQQNECQTVPDSQYEECMERANENYDEYSNKRKEIVEDKPDS